MSAPLALEHQAALTQLGRALAGVLASAAERTAIDSADDCRPLAPAMDATTPPSPPASKTTGAPLEDDRHEPTTIDA